MPSVHGVLLRVEGCGVLLTGPSRIGKSELALALLVETAVCDLRLRQAGYQADHDLLARQARQMEAQPCN